MGAYAAGGWQARPAVVRPCRRRRSSWTPHARAPGWGRPSPTKVKVRRRPSWS